MSVWCISVQNKTWTTNKQKSKLLLQTPESFGIPYSNSNRCWWKSLYWHTYMYVYKDVHVYVCMYLCLYIHLHRWMDKQTFWIFSLYVCMYKNWNVCSSIFVIQCWPRNQQDANEALKAHSHTNTCIDWWSDSPANNINTLSCT